MPAARGKYVVIEGQDGTGKSTQVARLRARLKKAGINSIEFHEPGESDKKSKTMPNKIREILLDKDLERVPSTNIALFSAARNELWQRPGGALEALNSGKWVIASRNWKSTLAYQGYGEGYNLDVIAITTRVLVGNEYFKPDYECIMYLEDEERLKRMAKRDNLSAKDTFESKASDFQKRVNDSYFDIAKEYDIDLIDGAGSEEEVEEKIATKISQKFDIKL